MTAASLEAMRARAREWLRESHNLRAAGFNLGAEEKRTDRLACAVLALLDMVEKREAALDESICERCGRDYPLWHAAHEAWNLAVNRTQEHGDEWQYLCPTCFVRLHEIATGKVHVWSLEVST